MSVIPSQYHEVRSRILPGDLVAFSGMNNVSDVIKWATGATVTHVGIVCQTTSFFDNGAQESVIVDIMESAFLHRDPATGRSVGGVQRNRLCSHIDSYDGHIWWLPLSVEARQRLDLEKFTRFLSDQEGKGYDVSQAVKSALDFMDDAPLVGEATRNREDFSKFFCSELATAALEAGGVIGQINASEVTPIDLCSFTLFEEHYHLLRGEVLEIEGYNSRCPERFGLC